MARIFPLAFPLTLWDPKLSIQEDLCVVIHFTRMLNGTGLVRFHFYFWLVGLLHNIKLYIPPLFSVPWLTGDSHDYCLLCILFLHSIMCFVDWSPHSKMVWIRFPIVSYIWDLRVCRLNKRFWVSIGTFKSDRDRLCFDFNLPKT